MVKLRNLPNNPESLSVKLLLKIRIQHVIKLVAAADRREGQDIAEGRAVVFNALVRLLLKCLKTLVQYLFSVGLKLDQKSEEADKVEKTTNRHQ